MAVLLSQEEILFDLAGTKCPKVKDGKSLPSYMYIGHFLKPYFKDKVTGVVSTGVFPWVCGVNILFIAL